MSDERPVLIHNIERFWAKLDVLVRDRSYAEPFKLHQTRVVRELLAWVISHIAPDFSDETLQAYHDACNRLLSCEEPPVQLTDNTFKACRVQRQHGASSAVVLFCSAMAHAFDDPPIVFGVMSGSATASGLMRKMLDACIPDASKRVKLSVAAPGIPAAVAVFDVGDFLILDNVDMNTVRIDGRIPVCFVGNESLLQTDASGAVTLNALERDHPSLARCSTYAAYFATNTRSATVCYSIPLPQCMAEKKDV